MSTNSITISWGIVTLEREVSDGYVFTAHWEANAEDGSYRSRAFGCITLERPDHLTPYESLSESAVVGWIKDKLGSEMVQEIETNLTAQIGEQKNPRVESGTPWESEFMSILAED